MYYIFQPNNMMYWQGETEIPREKRPLYPLQIPHGNETWPPR